MNISDDQLDRMIETAKATHANLSGRLLYAKGAGYINWSVLEQPEQDATALVHILETYRGLPKTADGVRVKPGDTVYQTTMTSRIIYDDVVMNTNAGWPTQHCYSTREAAEAAKARMA
jgi:hypothetical protein